MSSVNEKLKTIPDVEMAVVMTKDGAIVDDTSYEAEVLGANGQFLALFSEQVGSMLGLGEPKSLTVQGFTHHLFLTESKHHHLCVTAKGNSQSNNVESEIRRVLAQK